MPVDSIPTSVTFCSVNQSASISSCPVIVVNVRVSERRVPPGPGRRTVATTVSRCTSMPAHRSINTSIPAPLPRRRQEPPGVGNLSIKKLRCALEAAGQGASGSPRHTFLRARGTKKHRRRDRTTAPILPVTGAGASRHDHFFQEFVLHTEFAKFALGLGQLDPLMRAERRLIT